MVESRNGIEVFNVVRCQRGTTRSLTVLLSGGIGNLLFQYAAGLQVAAEHRRRLEFAERTDGAIARLQRFIGRALPVSGQIQSSILVGTAPARRNSARKMVSSQLAWIEAKRGAIVSVWTPHSPRPERIPQRVWGMKGWFQHPSWNNRAITYMCHELLQMEWFGVRPSQPFIALNLRRGDFVQLGWALDQAYYSRALEAMRDLQLPVVITGDDMLTVASVADQMRHLGFDVATPTDLGAHASAEHTHIDFWALAHARGVIMANSTYTWWATVIGDHVWQSSSERRVVYPLGWNGRPDADVLLRPTWTPVIGSLQRY